MKTYTVSQPSFILEWFDKDTGLRYHYDHLWNGKERMTKIEAIREFLRSDNSVFKSYNATVLVLFEIIGGRDSVFTEGAGSITKTRAIACKGLNVPARELTTFCIGGNGECNQYLRVKA